MEYALSLASQPLFITNRYGDVVVYTVDATAAMTWLDPHDAWAFLAADEDIRDRHVVVGFGTAGGGVR